MSKASDSAQAIADKCNELGWAFGVRGSILTINKCIKANDQADFVKADDGRVVRVPLVGDASTSGIIERIVKRFC